MRIHRTFSLVVLLALPVLGDAQSRPISAAEQLRVDAIFSRFTAPGSPGCIVGVNERGDARVRSAYGLADIERAVPMRPGLLVEVGSVSKQFTAASILLLERDGKLSIDQDVRRYWPTFPDFGATITMRHLLGHTAGLRDQYYLLALVGRQPDEVVTTVDEVVALLERQRTLNHPVGARYAYSNTGFTFAGALVERLSGQSLAEFSTARLFRPNGLAQAQWRDDFREIVPNRALAYRQRPDGAWEQDLPFSNLHGSGGLMMTVDEMLHWTELLHQDRIGPPGMLRAMTTVGRLNDGSATEYGLGLMVRQWRGVREIAHSGSTAGYRAYLAHYPDYGLSVAMQCNAANGDYVTLGRRVAELFLADRLQPVAAAAPAAAPRAQYSVAPATLATYAGRYRDAETGAVAEIVPADSAVVLRWGLHSRTRLQPLAEDSLAGGGIAVRVVRSPAGQVIAFYFDASRVLNVRFDRLVSPTP
jgi:CubicO group peptidase (beta-lactamase class C family)